MTETAPPPGIAPEPQPARPLWDAGTATGVGSLPGIDPAEADRLVLGELPALPYLPELPARGPGADLIGRGTQFLTEMAADLQPSGWRLIGRPGIDARRGRDLLSRDLDAFEEAAGVAGLTGPVKVQAAGPWTLAASLELPRGDKVLRDAGACRDVAASLAQGLSDHVRDLRRRLPASTSVLVQLDEPLLPDVLLGRLRTASGFADLRRPEQAEVVARLRSVADAVTAAGGVPGLHCCADRVPVTVAAAGGMRWVSLDLTLQQEEDALGEVLERGMSLVAGIVPSVDPLGTVAQTVAPLRELWNRLGLAVDGLAGVAVSPTCGLSGATPDHARAAMQRAREAASELLELAA